MEAWIIERLKREKEQRQDQGVPLHIELPRPQDLSDDRPQECGETSERGYCIIEW